MPWPVALLIIFGCLAILMISGMPVSFAFMITCSMGAILFWGGFGGIEQMIMSFYSSLVSFVLLPLPLFILMGTIIFESGAGELMVNAVDKILGRLPGKLGVLSVGAGALLGSMIGVSAGSIAILSKNLIPEMTKRGYNKTMVLGPIIASGTLATMIPPSAAAVLVGAIGKVSIGKLLIAIIIPGLLLTLLYVTYIIVRCKLQPALTPKYTETRVSILEKLSVAIRHIVPFGIVAFAVTGTVYMGIATPSEAAALGVIACFILAALYRKLNWRVIKNSAVSSLQVSAMVLIIIVAALSFSNVLAFSGAITGLIKLTMGLSVPPIVIIILTQIIVLILGSFIDTGSIVMITLPIFMPIVRELGFDIVWYSVMFLLNLQIGLITPPFGMDVYAMKAMVSSDISIGDIFRASMPFLGLCVLALILILVFPKIALWLPNLAR